MSDASTTVSTVPAGETDPNNLVDNRVLLLGNAEVNSILTFEEAIERAAARAETTRDDLTVIASPWLSIDTKGGKDYLIDRPFFCVDVAFRKDADTQRPFAVLHVITKDNEMFYVTDGSTGMMRQLAQIVGERLENGHPSPYEGFLIANGLRKSDYLLVKDEKGATVPAPANYPADGKIEGKATTYYLA